MESSGSSALGQDFFIIIIFFFFPCFNFAFDFKHFSAIQNLCVCSALAEFPGAWAQREKSIPTMLSVKRYELAGLRELQNICALQM